MNRPEECARLAAAGLSNKEIARQIKVTESTVKAYLKIAKLVYGYRTRAELAALFPPQDVRQRDGTAVPIAAVAHATLTPTEREVAGHLLAGRTDNETAAITGQSATTVKRHVCTILKKVNAPNRTAAAAMLRATLAPEAPHA